MVRPAAMRSSLFVGASLLLGCAEAAPQQLESDVTAGSAFDPASCPGSDPLDVASKFAPGAREAVLGRYRVAIEKRNCTTVSGCGPWAPATMSSGPSGAGEAMLRVRDDGSVDLVLVDDDASSEYGTPRVDLGQTFDIHGTAVASRASSYRTTHWQRGTWSAKVGADRTPPGVDTGELSGDLHATCLRATAMSQRVGTAIYAEYRTGVLVRF
jgi:hypothetical protein